LSLLVGRTIGFNKLSITGADVIRVMTQLNGVSPEVARTTIDEMDRRIKLGHPLSLAYAVTRKHSVGSDVHEVQRYAKETLENLMLDKQLIHYRSIPIDKSKVLNEFFQTKRSAVGSGVERACNLSGHATIEQKTNENGLGGRVW
jgi:hypothetical protein